MAAIKEAGYQIGGDQYKRVLIGVAPDHPRAKLLKYEGLHAPISDVDSELIKKPEFRISHMNSGVKWRLCIIGWLNSPRDQLGLCEILH